jgi:hypothetical protein
MDKQYVEALVKKSVVRNSRLYNLFVIYKLLNKL